MNGFLARQLAAYSPCCEQEARDKAVMLRFLREHPDALLRENETAHFTASAWLTTPAHDRVLMVWHSIYRSWSWPGGHADGEEDLLAAALREAREETGLSHIRAASPDIFSLETLPVAGHEKRGVYVPCHLHLNVTWLLEADAGQPVRPCPGENRAVRWFTPCEAVAASSEPWMRERIYKKLNRKLLALRP